MVCDLANPIDSLFFVFHNNLDINIFDHYFCLMDVDKLCKAKKENDLNFDEYI